MWHVLEYYGTDAVASKTGGTIVVPRAPLTGQEESRARKGIDRLVYLKK